MHVVLKNLWLAEQQISAAGNLWFVNVETAAQLYSKALSKNIVHTLNVRNIKYRLFLE